MAKIMVGVLLPKVEKGRTFGHSPAFVVMGAGRSIRIKFLGDVAFSDTFQT